MLELLAEEMIFGLPEDVPDHFMRILDGMRRRQYSSKNLAACCFNREEDKYLGLPL